MKKHQTITLLVVLIALISAVTSAVGIFSGGGSGSFQYESIRGGIVDIYGKGLYRHMSADVAIQGIAQDFVTLFAAIPLLLISLYGYRKRSVRYHFLLSGIVGYFFVTFLFYTAMGMYNIMFLCYVALLGLSFFALFLSLSSFEISKVSQHFSDRTPYKIAGSFLIFNSVAIAVLWLGIIIPPLLDGSIYPVELQHYTTLIVQGFDLGLLLPACFVVGILLIKRNSAGYLFGTVYFVFLSLLMTALTAKIIAMAINGVNVIPVVFIIPTINIVTILFSVLLLRSVKKMKKV